MLIIVHNCHFFVTNLSLFLYFKVYVSFWTATISATVIWWQLWSKWWHVEWSVDGNVSQLVTPFLLLSLHPNNNIAYWFYFAWPSWPVCSYIFLLMFECCVCTYALPYCHSQIELLSFWSTLLGDCVLCGLFVGVLSVICFSLSGSLCCIVLWCCLPVNWICLLSVVGWS